MGHNDYINAANMRLIARKGDDSPETIVLKKIESAARCGEFSIVTTMSIPWEDEQLLTERGFFVEKISNPGDGEKTKITW